MRLRGSRRRGTSQRAGFWFIGVLAVAVAFLHPTSTVADDAKPADGVSLDPSKVEFFEKTVRPLLAARCQGCHGASKQKGGLRLDSRAAVLAGGNTGPAVVPGDAGESLLIDAINYGEDVQMPPKSKLPEPEIAALTRWVEMGAPWGRDVPAATGAKPGSPDFQETLRERSRFWSLPAAPQDRSRPTRPIPAAGRGTRSTASSWPGWRAGASRPRPRPTAGP